MQSVKKVGGVMHAGMQGYQKGRIQGDSLVNAAQMLDSHMDKANMDAIAGRPHPHDIFVNRYANNKTAARMNRYYQRYQPRHMPGPRSGAYYAYEYNLPTPAGETAGERRTQRFLPSPQSPLLAGAAGNGCTVLV